MSNLDIVKNIKSGSKARLIPTLADSKKEEKATSVLLSMFMFVPSFAEAILQEAGAKVGQRSKITCYTEVVFDEKKSNNPGSRLDGLIIIKLGKKTWSAIVESKVGNNIVDKEQIEKYLDLAKSVGANAVITISNQFATIPTHHPVTISKNKTKVVDLYHFSWLSVLSKAAVISNSKSITDFEQKYLLKELIRYLKHPSSGISAMNSMNPSWKDVCSNIQQGAILKKSNPDIKETVISWQQLLRYLAVELSMITNSNVTVAVSKKYKDNPELKIVDESSNLARNGLLDGDLSISNAASNITIVADFTRRVISISMKVLTPKDKTRPTAPINWLTKQLKSVESDEVLLRAIWPGRCANTQGKFNSVVSTPELLVPEGMKDLPKYIQVIQVVDMGGKFKQTQSFIKELHAAITLYYKDIGQYLENWAPKAPKAELLSPPIHQKNNVLTESITLKPKINLDIIEPVVEDKSVEP